MRSILILMTSLLFLQTPVAGAHGAIEAESADLCGALLIQHVQRASAAEGFQPLADLSTELASRPRATVLLRLSLRSAVARVTKLVDFSYAPKDLNLEPDLFTIIGSNLYVVADGPRESLLRFGADFVRHQGQLAGASSSFQILDSEVEAELLSIAPGGKMIPVDSGQNTANGVFAAAVEAAQSSNQGFMVFDSNLKKLFFILPAKPVAGGLTADQLGARAGLKVETASTDRSLFSWLTSHPSAYADAPTLIQYGDLYVSTGAATDALLGLNGEKVTTLDSSTVAVSPELQKALRKCFGAKCVPVPAPVAAPAPAATPAPPAARTATAAPPIPPALSVVRAAPVKAPQAATPPKSPAVPPKPILSAVKDSSVKRTAQDQADKWESEALHIFPPNLVAKLNMLDQGYFNLESDAKMQTKLVEWLATREGKKQYPVIQTFRSTIKPVLDQLSANIAMMRDPGTEVEILELIRNEQPQLLNNLREARQHLVRKVSGSENESGTAVIVEVAPESGQIYGENVERLYRMYAGLAKARGWQIETIEKTYGDRGPMKYFALRIEGEDALAMLKFERGTHRFIENEGKEVTNYIDVRVYREPHSSDVDLRESDLEISTMRASGPGGQNVNKVESAVRVRHLPSNIAVKVDIHRSQSANKRTALAMIAARLQAVREAQAHKANQLDRNQISTAGQLYTRVYDLRASSVQLRKVMDGEIGEDLHERMIQSALAKLLDWKI